MKIQKLIGKLLLLPAVVVPFASCIDKPDIPEIGISNFVFHVVQNTTETGTEYIPYIGFQYNGDEKLDYGVIELDGQPFELTTNEELQFCQINPQNYKVTSLTDLNGEYTFNSVGVKGHDWERSFSVEFDGDEAMSEVVVQEFGYKNGKIYATFLKNEAHRYGFYIQACGSDGRPNSYYAISNDYEYLTDKNLSFNMFRTVPAEVTAVPSQTVEYQFDMDGYEYYFGAERVLITPITVNFTPEGGWKLVRESEHTGILTSDDTEKVWVEPQPEPAE